MDQAAVDHYQPPPPAVLEQDLAGKVAIVTGATRGIGRAIALHLACRGASILGTYSAETSAAGFESLASIIADIYSKSSIPKPKVVGIAASITSPDCAATIADALHTKLEGKLDILVLSAAVMEVGVVGKIEADYVSRILLGNIQTPVLIIEELVRRKMFRPNSRIVAISSDGGRRPRTGSSLYSATKSALESLVRAWADELGRHPGMEGTTVNSVAVGLTNSDAVKKLPQEYAKKVIESDASTVSVGNRIGECEDIADVVGLLVSERARWITGNVVGATGGAIKIL